MEEYIKRIAKTKKQERFNAIVDILKELDVNYSIQDIPYPDALGNIIVELKKSEGKKLVISAHYDNYNNTPGANDNASACAILLKLIKKFKNCNMHLEFVFFDLEESGMIGSTYYLKQNKDKIGLVYNLDMCGLGNNIVYSINNMEDDYKKISNLYNALRVKRLPIGDADTFITRGIPTIYVVNSTDRDIIWYKDYEMGRRPKVYPDFLKTMHQANDTIDTININQVNKIVMFMTDMLKVNELKEMREKNEKSGFKRILIYEDCAPAGLTVDEMIELLLKNHQEY